MAADEFGIDWDAAGSVEHKPDVSSVNTETPASAPAPEGGSGIVEDLLLHGVVGGVEQAGRGVYSTVKAGADAVGLDMPDLGEPLVGEAESVPAQIVRDVTQFGLGFVGGMNLLRVTGAAAKLAPFAKEIIASGLGTGLVADPTAPRLANLIQKYPWLENPVAEYLQQDDTDGIAESKFKAALEDMMVTPAAMGLFKTVKALKSALKGDHIEAGKLADEIVQDSKGATDVAAKGVDIELPEVKVTPEDGTAPVVKEVEEVFATEIKSPGGKTIFKLTQDEEHAFDAHLNYLVSNNHLEDVFNFPAFEAFNPRRSDATADTQEVIAALSQYIKPKLDKLMYGEKQTHAEVKKFADLLQEDEKVLYARLQQAAEQMADLPALVTAAEGFTYSLAREARRLAIKNHMGAASAEEKAALALTEQRLTDVFGMTRAISKGAARTTSAGRITVGESDLNELTKLLALTKDEKEVLGVLKPKSLMGKLIDAHNEVWINGILSGVKTHVVNLTSASVNTLLTPFNQVVGGVITRNADEVREGFALYRGLYRHIFDSLEMAGRAFKAEHAVLDPGKSTDEAMEKAISGKNFESLGRFADWLGVAARIPGRFLKAEDEFFKQMNYRAKVEARAAREAAGLVADGKLDPKKLVDYTDGTKTIKVSEVEAFIREKFKSAFSPDQIGLNKDAIEYSREITFTQDLNAISTYDWFGNPGARIQAFASGHPWLRGAVLPFIKVPTNLMRAVGDLTPPIAALKKEGMDILTGANVDPTKRAMFAGRLATGSMLWSAATMLALQGRITGAAYGDKDMRNRQMESGWQPYSFVFEGENGKKEYVSFQRLDPFGTFFGLAADWAYIAQHVDADSGHNWATMASLALAKNIASKSYLQGIVEWAGMLGGGYTAEEQVKRMVQMRAASYVPNYMNLYTGNDELKEIRSITDAMMAKIPGLSSQVEAKRDYFGEKRVAPMGYPWNAIDPFPVSEEKDAVRKELARLSRSQSEARFTMPDTKMGNVDLTQVRNAAGQTAYDRWTEKIGQVEIGGKTFHQKLEEVIGSFRYQEGTDGTSAYHNGNRIVMIKNWQEKYREKALRETLKEFEAEFQGGKVKDNLRDMTRTDKRNEKAMSHGRVDRIRDLLNLSQ